MLSERYQFIVNLINSVSFALSTPMKLISRLLHNVKYLSTNQILILLLIRFNDVFEQFDPLSEFKVFLCNRKQFIVFGIIPFGKFFYFIPEVLI